MYYSVNSQKQQKTRKGRVRPAKKREKKTAKKCTTGTPLPPLFFHVTCRAVRARESRTLSPPHRISEIKGERGLNNHL